VRLHSHTFNLYFWNGVRALKKHRQMDESCMRMVCNKLLNYCDSLQGKLGLYIAGAWGEGGTAQELPPTNCTMQGGPDVILGYRILFVV
jgi:hypothetical protein